MKCPKCGHPRTKCYGSPRTKRGERYRYRICLSAKCGEKFNTLEVVVVRRVEFRRA